MIRKKTPSGATTPKKLPTGRLTPTLPGFYWALWISASKGTHEGDQLAPSQEWEIVEVFENFVGDPCEDDEADKFGVAVTGVRETQWIENFKWGAGPIEQYPTVKRPVTGRTIPDLTNQEHVCEWQREVKAK